MNTEETIAYLRGLTLAAALMWFIENIAVGDARSSEVFFYLRSRYREEQQS